MSVTCTNCGGPPTHTAVDDNGDKLVTTFRYVGVETRADGTSYAVLEVMPCTVIPYDPPWSPYPVGKIRPLARASGCPGPDAGGCPWSWCEECRGR